MANEDEDDKPTVVLDLNALKKQALKDHEDLTSVAQSLRDLMGGEAIEFNVNLEEKSAESASDPLSALAPETEPDPEPRFEVILFDFQSDFFQSHLDLMPAGFQYIVATSLPELNAAISAKQFKILIFNYDTNPKAVNKLSAQIKQKFPHVKTLIVAKSISPEKARAHSQTASGANGYYQLPLLTEKLENQFNRMAKTAG